MTSQPPPQCALDATGARGQGARYARLATAVAAVEREPGSLTVSFTPDVDRDLLDETLAVERRCCPFFELEYDDGERRLHASVSAAEHRPALDALAATLG